MKSAFSFLCFWAIVTGCEPKPETYLIPDGFKGKINIIFNQPRGLPQRYENGRRVYDIPSNGILLTRFKDEYGIIDHQYFYVDKGGNKSPLEIFHYQYNKDGTTKWIIQDSGKVGIFLDGTTGGYGGNNNLKYQEFMVTDFFHIDSFYKSAYQNEFKKRLQEKLKDDFRPGALNLQELDTIERHMNQNTK
jgi:hypothetical protein